MKPKVNIFWFRRDLRLKDNIGLYWALKSDFPVLPIFIFDKKILKNLPSNDPRVNFIHQSLSNINKELNSIGSTLLSFHDTPEDCFSNISKKYDIKTVFANEDYEPYGTKRDEKIRKQLAKNDIELMLFKDHCIFSKNDILKDNGEPYTVYTPYKNKWLRSVTPSDISSYNCKKYYFNFFKYDSTQILSLKDIGFSHKKNHLNFPKKIIKRKTIVSYHEDRDIPSLDATSHLGIHLRFGTISTRKAVQIALELNQTWLSELIWREFFMQILYHFPHVEKKAFRPKYDKIKWLNKKSDFKKWCTGTTGYPLVDAGMRELNATGYMHNRVRMLVASFLVKNLLINWQWGEKYFAEKLLDFELASNNGNWQWAAGTGCDAAPYFRIFNPETQVKKFDPDLEYIKKWVPEYQTDQYPEKMVDLKVTYHRAITTYKSSIHQGG
jgi:deoxyribodipyrimidine photo-lyase